MNTLSRVGQLEGKQEDNKSDSLVYLSIVILVFGAYLLELLINDFPVFGIFSGALCVHVSLIRCVSIWLELNVKCLPERQLGHKS